MSKVTTLLLIAAVSMSLSDEINAQTAARGQPAAAVVELFTSQGCYSCPPADALLGDLAATRPDVVALEFHVDYWDQLVYGSAGKWKDPFSSPAHTARQRDYNARSLDGRRGVYTPQMVVNGDYALVGSNRAELTARLGESGSLPVPVTVERADGELRAHFSSGHEFPAEIFQANLIDHARTPVAAGENNGKFLDNHNIVTKLWHLGSLRDAALEAVPLKPKEPDHGCAVIVQEPSGRIVGAAYCPG
jgi:hypothetical protein